MNTLRKSPIIAFAETLYKKAEDICTEANGGVNPGIIIKAWDGTLDERIKEVMNSLDVVIVMERPEFEPERLSKEGMGLAKWHITIESNPLLNSVGWDADDLADIIHAGFHKWRRDHPRISLTEVIVTNSKPSPAKILKKSIVLTMETKLTIKL